MYSVQPRRKPAKHQSAIEGRLTKANVAATLFRTSAAHTSLGSVESKVTVRQKVTNSAPRGGHVAIYPGSFDPMTNGHLDLIERGAKLVDRAHSSPSCGNDSKQPLFTVEEAMEMLFGSGRPLCQCRAVDCFDGLLVEYASRKEATVILRGIRAISDYEFELQMALMNRRLRGRISRRFF